MDTFCVLETGDIFEDSLSCLFPRLERFQVDQFLFDYAVKQFDARIIVTIAFAAHAAFHLECPKARLIIKGGILAAAI